MTPTIKSYVCWPALLCCICCLGASLPAATTLLPYGSVWFYFDNGYLPTADWAQPTYSHSGWNFGNGQLGYGDGDEATIVGFGPDDEHKFITTYFRTYVYINNPAQFASVTLHLIRDDGAVVYLNGAEVFRSNLPDGAIGYDTYALTGIIYGDESTPVSATLDPAMFVQGDNLIAVEMHQFEPASPDLSFDLQLLGDPVVVRGPYLQVGTSSNIVVRWRTSAATTTRVHYGTTAGSLNAVASDNTLATDHEIILDGLLPDTKYFYDIGTTTALLAGDSTYFFVTAPVPGTPKPTRIWAIGDFGTGFAAQGQVRDAYVSFAAGRNTDVWLMLGDNAYYSGMDHEYQSYVFNVYPRLLRQSVVWPTMGNHETAQNATLSDAYAYYDIFTMPRSGQSGGVPSGSEHYYSFDYANIHFVCLDSMTTIFRQTNSTMAQWLRADLADATRDWVIAYWHHPPYTHGSHNSDYETQLVEMRGKIVPILESYGVDLVLSGHSHSYERSFLIDGFYGLSANATNFMNHGDGRVDGAGAYVKPANPSGARRGAVYIVDGSSGGQGGGGLLDHPAMFYSTLTAGSLVIDIASNRLDAKFISGNGTVDDTFTILKEALPSLRIDRADTNALLSWTSLLEYQVEAKPTIQTTQWLTVAGIVSSNAEGKSMSIPAAVSNQFFRLRLP